MGKSQATENQIFSGGVNLVPAAHLLPPTDSRLLDGINVRKGPLQPFQKSLLVKEASNSFGYFYNDEFHFYPLFRSNVLYNKVWYWSSVAECGKMYEDGTIHTLGISPPTGQLVATAQTHANGLSGSINYVYTYFDRASGSESPPSKPSNTLDLFGADAKKAVQLSNITPSVDGYEIRLYRIGGLQTMYTAVDTLPSTTTDYIDFKSYIEIQGMLLDTLRAYPPPTGLQYLTLHQSRFFGAVNSYLMFTPPGKPDSWYALDFIGFDDIITSIVSVSNGLLVMSKHKTWLVTGNQPSTFSVHILSGSEGCISPLTIAVQEGTAIWLSTSGFLLSNGSRVDNLSLFKLGRISSVEPYGATYLNKRYVLTFGGTLYPSKDLYPSEELHPSDIVTDSGVALQAGCIVIDFSLGKPIFSTITDPTMGYIFDADNDIYHITNDGMGEGNIVTESGNYNIVTEGGLSNIVATLETKGSLYKTFRGSGLRTIAYRSPIHTEGSLSVQKQYEKVRITYLGTGLIEIYDEDRKLFTSQELQSDRMISEWVGIPVKFNRGYGIQFRITGVVIVESLQWIWTPKEAQ